MSGPDESGQQASIAPDAAGVLAKLPRTRPQRSSPRREAARASSSSPRRAPSASSSSSRRAPSASSSSPRAARTTNAKAAVAGRAKAAVAGTPAPRQGFECEGEQRSRTVNPPGGAELVASAAEIVGELAKAGVSAGERLLKDALSRFPRP